MAERDGRELLRRVEAQLRQRDPDFRWQRPGPPVLAGPAPNRPRLALVTTAGFHHRDDQPFDVLNRPGGDPGFRVIAHDLPAEQLALGEPYVDQKYAAVDPECALPRRALDALAARGAVGQPPARHYSFCGGLVRPFPGLGQWLRRLNESLVEDRVEAVVLLPTCSVCVQTVCLVARAIEQAGIPTVSLSLLPALSRLIGAPRLLNIRFPFGAPAGDPGHAALHQAVLLEAVEMLTGSHPGPPIRDSTLRWRG